MAQIIDFQIGSIATTAAIAAPPGNGPFPGVVLTFHRNGLDAFTNFLVDDLAANGFSVIAPNHFHALPPGKGPDDRKDYLTDEQMALDLRAAAAWLAAQKAVTPKRFGLLGHCMGGRTTLLGLVDSPELWACGCVWYGGGVMRPMGKLPAPFDRFGNIEAPVAGFFGNNDKNPSPADVDKMDAALSKLHKVHEFYRYDNTGHAFVNAWSSNYREGSAKDSLDKGYKFLKRHLPA